MAGRGEDAKAKNGLWRAMLAALALLMLGPLASASAAPALTITSPTQGSSTSQPAPAFAGEAEDTLDVVVVHIFPGEDTTSTQAHELEAAPSEGAWGVQGAALSDGTYTAVAQQLDSETAETAESSPVTFTVDTVAPVLSLNPVASPTDDSTPTLSGNAGVLPGDAGTVAVGIYSGTVVSGSPVASAHPSIGGFGGWSYTPASLPEGTYTAQAFQEDEAGNVGASGAVTFTVDTAPPAVTLSAVGSPTDDATPSFSGGVGAAAGDLASVQVVVHKGTLAGAVAAEGSASVSGGTWSYTSPSLTDGQYTVQAIQHDQAGNEGKSASATFTVDTTAPTAPTLSVTTPKGGEILKSSKVSFSGSTGNEPGDSSTVTVEIFTGTSASGSPAQTLTGARSGSTWTTAGKELRLTNDTYTVRAKQSDLAGNIGQSAPVTFTVESSAPTVTLNRLPEYTNDAEPSFSGSADTSEAGSEVTLKIWRGTSASGTLAELPVKVTQSAGAWFATASKALSEGVYTAQAEQAADPESNPAGVSATTTFTVDTTAPVPTLSAPAASSGVETVSGTAGVASGDRRQITVELFTGATAEAGDAFETITVNASAGSWSATFAGLEGGQYTAIARQSDEAGNVGRSEAGTFTVTTPATSAPAAPSPPVASFAWVPAAPTVGQSVSLVSNSTDASSPINAFAWDVAGAGQFAPGGPVVSTSFATPGPHVVQLRVTDANGLSSVATRTIAVAAATLRLMQPFPIVRIAGSETSNGVKIRLLTVQTPLLSTVVVSCKGRGCKTKSERRVATASSKSKSKAGAVLLTFNRFQRALRAGVVLQVRVYKVGQIGKFTSFKVRRHKLPLRADACLGPTSPTPIACPAS
jgi:large repetitive protein